MGRNWHKFFFGDFFLGLGLGTRRSLHYIFIITSYPTMNQLQLINAAQPSNSRLKKTKMKTVLLSKGATAFFAASSSLSLLSVVSAAEATVAAAAVASPDDLKSARRQLSNSYAHRALMRDEQRSDVPDPDVATIINGTETGGPLSYQVGLATGAGKLPLCGGSLIASRVVLTAAHCVIDDDYKPSNPPTDKVLINGYDVKKTTSLIPQGSGYIAASSYVAHPGYNTTTVENDIALLFLPFPIGEDDNFKFATLNEDPTVPADGEELFVSGWGNTVDVYSPSPVLLGTNLDYITNEQCNDSDWDGDITDGMMCAERDGTAECRGDSGGPLVIADGDRPAMDPTIQVGIVSFSGGDKCGDPDYPGVFTRVSSYIDWIHSTACQKVGEFCPSSSKSGKGKSKAYKNVSP
jgi:hypothetical protein